MTKPRVPVTAMGARGFPHVAARLSVSGTGNRGRRRRGPGIRPLPSAAGGGRPVDRVGRPSRSAPFAVGRPAPQGRRPFATSASWWNQAFPFDLPGAPEAIGGRPLRGLRADGGVPGGRPSTSPGVPRNTPSRGGPHNGDRGPRRSARSGRPARNPPRTPRRKLCRKPVPGARRLRHAHPARP